MDFKTMKIGPIQTNCYIISDNNEALVIDPGFDIDQILPLLKDTTVNAIVLTHGHFDHVTEAFLLQAKTKAPVLIHEKDETMMAFTNKMKANRLLKDGDVITVGNEKFVVIHTPGHSSGSICLYNEKEKLLFSGDTLFYGTYGRTDLPGSSQKEMEKSLKKLLKLPENVKVYPGHGRETTIGDEQSLTQSQLF